MSADPAERRSFDSVAAVGSPRREENGAYGCPCCDSLSFGAPGGWEICGVCSWEDDPVQESQPSLAGGANKVSLIEARLNYKRFGRSEPPFEKRKLP